MKGPELVLHISVMSSLLLVCRLELSVMLLQRHPGETERASTFFAERSQKKETFSELKKTFKQAVNLTPHPFFLEVTRSVFIL